MPQVFWAYFLDLELEPFQILFLLAAEQYHRLLGEWPAGFGKSTNMSYGYPLWHVARNGNVRIMQIGKTTEEMDSYGLLTRNTMEKNERLIAWYGAFRELTPERRRLQPWSSTGVNVAQRQIYDPHNTIEWFGSNSDAALGHRCDIIIIDDVVTPDTAGTPERRKKLEYRMREQWQTAPQYRFKISTKLSDYPVHDPISGNFAGFLQVPRTVDWPHGIEYEKIIVVGTVFHYQDLYHVLERDKSFHFIRKDCFVTKPDGSLDSLWPGRWSLEKLEQERISQGNLPFNRRYRNICISEDDLAFRPEDIERCLDSRRLIGDYDPAWRRILSLDPASGNASRFSAYPAFTLWGYDPDDPERKRHLIDLVCRRDMGYHAMLETATDLRRRYGYDLFVIEKNAFGAWLMDSADPHIKELEAAGVRLVGHYTGGNKRDPEWGVKSLDSFLRNGLYSIPYGDEYSQLAVAPWIEQMQMFPQGYQDLAMSTWFADLQMRAPKYDTGPIKPGGGKFYTRIDLEAGNSHRRPPRAAPGTDT